MTADDSTPPPVPQDAAVAVADVDAARAGVAAAEGRGLPLVLAATAVLTFLDYAAKDEISSPRRRAAATVVIQTAIGGIALLDSRADPVNPYAVATGPQPALAGRLAGVALGWFAAERLTVHLLRRSRLRRPNTVAGLVLAVSRPAATLVLTRMLPRADRGA